MTLCLRDLHECCYLHRDVKPANFTVGPVIEDGDHQSRIVYMIDFGLCRSYLDSSGKHFAARNRAGFRGTPRYASIDCLRGVDVGRRDDLWSLFYVLIELMVGQLPWRRLNEKKEVRIFFLLPKVELLFFCLSIFAFYVARFFLIYKDFFC